MNEWHWTDDVGTPVRCLVVVFAFFMANYAMVIWLAGLDLPQMLELALILLVWAFTPALAMEWVGCFRKPEKRPFPPTNRRYITKDDLDKIDKVKAEWARKMAWRPRKDGG